MVAIQHVLLPLSGAIVLAVQALLLRMATRRERVTDVLVIVLLVNVGLILPVASVASYPAYGLTVRSLGAFVAAGIVGSVVGRIALFVGIQRVGASRAEPLKASSPFFAVLIAFVALGERMVAEHFLGVVLIVVGIAVISWEHASGPNYEELGSATDLVFPLLASLLFAIEPSFAKIGLDDGTPFIVGLAIKVLAALLGFLGYLYWQRDLPGLGSLLETDALWWSLAAGLANTAFVFVLYASLSLSPVVIVFPIIQASPLFVVLLSYVFIQDVERVTAKLAGGVAVVVAGGVLVALFG